MLLGTVLRYSGDERNLQRRERGFLLSYFWSRRGWTNERRRELARCRALPPAHWHQRRWHIPAIELLPLELCPTRLARYGPSRRCCLGGAPELAIRQPYSRAPGKRGLVTLQAAGYDTIGCTITITITRCDDNARRDLAFIRCTTAPKRTCPFSSAVTGKRGPS